jgi:hypothetical protein
MCGPRGTMPTVLNRFNTVKMIQTDLNSTQTLPNLVSSKQDVPELENFEIKYCFEGFNERNKFPCRNFYRFEVDFE